jgi:hypothetical protein
MIQYRIHNDIFRRILLWSKTTAMITIIKKYPFIYGSQNKKPFV